MCLGVYKAVDIILVTAAKWLRMFLKNNKDDDMGLLTLLLGPGTDRLEFS